MLFLHGIAVRICRQPAVISRHLRCCSASAPWLFTGQPIAQSATPLLAASCCRPPLDRVRHRRAQLPVPLQPQPATSATQFAAAVCQTAGAPPPRRQGRYSRSPLFCANAGMKSAPSPGGRSGCAPADGCVMPCSTLPTSQGIARATLQSAGIISQTHRYRP